MNITAKELSGEHIGKIVTIPDKDATYTGRITMITQRYDETAIQIRDRALYIVHVHDSTPITIQEDK